MFRQKRELTEWGFYLPSGTLEYTSNNGFHEWEYTRELNNEVLNTVVIWKTRNSWEWEVNSYYLGINKQKGTTTTLRKAMIIASNVLKKNIKFA